MQRFNYAVIEQATGKTVALCAQQKDAHIIANQLLRVYGRSYRVEEKIIEPRHKNTI